MEILESTGLNKGLQLVSHETGILNYITKLPRSHADPKLVTYGIWPCDSTVLGGNKYSGRSSGCGYNWTNAALSTLGEVVERYCPAFYRKEDLIKSSYRNLGKKAVNPADMALFHDEQYKALTFPFVKFTEDLEINWVKCKSLINGDDVYCPGAKIYIPWVENEEWIGIATSTGLAAHTDLYEAILTGLYELIERDSFMIYWLQQPNVQKIMIDEDTNAFLKSNYPENYEFHFFDISTDLETPSIFGFCIGESDFGKFISVGSASRGTYGETLHKVIMEMGQAVSYFRYLLGKRNNWYPERFEECVNFEEHSLFYLKRTDCWDIFDKWINLEPTKKINFQEKRKTSAIHEVRRILKVMDKLGYDVLFKDLTTPDIREIGYKCVKVVVPQLLEMAGIYSYYFKGGNRLFEVPKKLGQVSKGYDYLNKYPHPFP